MINEDIYKNLIDMIIKAQMDIIGPLARDLADKVAGIHNNPSKEKLGELVKQYESIFGLASVETCKDAIRDIVAQNDGIDLPGILK